MSDDEDDDKSELTKYHTMKHPNLQKDEEEEKDKGCIHYFRIIDNLVLRPVFIYKHKRTLN